MFCSPSDYIEAGSKLELVEELKNLFNSTAIIKNIAKGTVIRRQGEVASSLYYIHKGIVRGYYVDESGNDVTKCFASEGEFACAEGLIRDGVSTFSVECLEDCICIIIPYSAINQGKNKISQMKEIFDEYIHKIFLNMFKREKELLLEDATVRYMEFKKENPSIEERINQEYIASYIGIRASSLSRIRRSIKMG